MADRLWLVGSLLALGGAILFFGVCFAPAHYGIYAFLGLYQMLALQLLLHGDSLQHRLLSLGVRALLALGLLLALIEPLRTVALFPSYLLSGTTYPQALRAFTAIEKGNCALMHTSGLAVLDESMGGSQWKADRNGNAILSQRIQREESSKPCLIVIVQETNRNGAIPRTMRRIIDSRDRSAWTAQLSQWRLIQSPKGYGFQGFQQSLPLPGQPDAEGTAPGARP